MFKYILNTDFDIFNYFIFKMAMLQRHLTSSDIIYSLHFILLIITFKIQAHFSNKSIDTKRLINVISIVIKQCEMLTLYLHLNSISYSGLGNNEHYLPQINISVHFDLRRLGK